MATDKTARPRTAAPATPAASVPDDVQYFEGSITKHVLVKSADGGTQTVEVLSDNLCPGEKRVK